jgi:hypothetical protein
MSCGDGGTAVPEPGLVSVDLQESSTPNQSPIQNRTRMKYMFVIYLRQVSYHVGCKNRYQARDPSRLIPRY